MADPYIGRTVGDLTVTARIGGRPMAPIYRARHRRLRIERSVQILTAADPKRALEEVGRLSRIRDRNLVRIHDSGELEEGGIYVVQELLNGEPLDVAIARDGGASIRDALRTIRDAAAGLARAHEAGVVHRDLRPRALFLAREGGVAVVKAVDFRFDWPTDGDSATAIARSLPPDDLCHFAPEQLGHGGAAAEIGPRVDVYALGLCLWEALTGMQALDPLPMAQALELRRSPLAAPSTRTDRVDPGLDRLVEAMTSFEPADRPADAGAVRDELDALLTNVRRPGRPTSAAATTGSSRATKRSQPAAPAAVPEPAREFLDREIARPDPDASPPDDVTVRPAATLREEPRGEPVRQPEAREPSVRETSEAVAAASEGRLSGESPRSGFLPRWAIVLAVLAALALWLMPRTLEQTATRDAAERPQAVDAADLDAALDETDDARLWDWLGTYPQSTHRARAYLALLERGAGAETVCQHARRWSPGLLEGRGELARACR